MKVRVIKCSVDTYWYVNNIGKVFEVVSCEFLGDDPFKFKLLEECLYFDYRDVEVVEERTKYEDPTKERVVVKGNVIKIKSAQGYCIPAESTLLKLTDTGNGYIAKFPSYSSVHQDNYICLDYSEADYLFKALKAVYEPK